MKPEIMVKVRVGRVERAETQLKSRGPADQVKTDSRNVISTSVKLHSLRIFLQLMATASAFLREGDPGFTPKEKGTRLHSNLIDVDINGRPLDTSSGIMVEWVARALIAPVIMNATYQALLPPSVNTGNSRVAPPRCPRMAVAQSEMTTFGDTLPSGALLQRQYPGVRLPAQTQKAPRLLPQAVIAICKGDYSRLAWDTPLSNSGYTSRSWWSPRRPKVPCASPIPDPSQRVIGCEPLPASQQRKLVDVGIIQIRNSEGKGRKRIGIIITASRLRLRETSLSIACEGSPI
ncbi:hypothetical protein EDB83DRAFT_2558421 [Lactarius deliciosus]|nr:hypothetical protein EDB83DRAFT_2558421 [Lactarius deliciosus]